MSKLSYINFADDSKVWIYQSNRPFTEEEKATLKEEIHAFANQWVSHNQALTAFGMLMHNQFIVLMVDETGAGASGCSIDKSVHFIKAVEQKYQVQLFDRMTFAYIEGERVKTMTKQEMSEWYQQGILTDETMVFNNLVKNRAEFEQGWVVPLGESWHKRFV